MAVARSAVLGLVDGSLAILPFRVKESALIFRSLAIGLIVLSGTAAATEGMIDGVVVNGSRDHAAAAGVEVVLRVPFDGEFVVAAQTTTAADGTFRFTRLPLDGPDVYLPGANLADVHFPGPRIVLDASQPHVSLQLAVFESIVEPSPLVLEDHKIVVQAEPGSVRVRETMLINNPSLKCFVGKPQHEGGGPVTLQLGIPAEFERITFDKEGFGRQFRLINGKLVTGIPWPPGQRELAFSYVIPNQQGNRSWQRRVDLPSAQVQITARGNDPQHVACSLPAAASTQPGELLFTSQGPPMRPAR